MPYQEEISTLTARLAAYRRTLQIYLQQLAILGIAHAPPSIFHGIEECRQNIQEIKGSLRLLSISVDDHPDDNSHENSAKASPEELRSDDLRSYSDQAFSAFTRKDWSSTIILCTNILLYSPDNTEIKSILLHARSFQEIQQEQIEQTFKSTRNTIISLSNRFSAIIKECFPSNYELILQRLTSIDTVLFKIAIIGRRKSGKSTFLNALVGENAIPNSKFSYSTSIPIIVEHDLYHNILFSKPNGSSPKTISADSLEELIATNNEYAEANFSSEDIGDGRHVNIKHPNLFLPNNVQIIDTPPIFTRQIFQRTTINLLYECHAAILVVDATTYLDHSEIDLIHDILDLGLSLFVVFNKIDLLNKVELDILKMKAEKDLAEILGYFPEKDSRLPLAFVSAKTTLDLRTKQNPKLLTAYFRDIEVSGLFHFEIQLHNFLTSNLKTEAVLHSISKRFSDALSAANQQIETAQQRILDDMDELEERIKYIQKKINPIDIKSEDPSLYRSVKENLETYRKGKEIASDLIQKLENSKRETKEINKLLQEIISRAISLHKYN